MSAFTSLSARLFNMVHANNLIYNTCWEDPRLDRQALALTARDRVLMITSAGCNALDYALDGPAHIYAVDINPRQNALLELKLAGIRSLDFSDFFQLFGEGFHPDVRTLYRRLLRPALPTAARTYWDGHLDYFSGRGRRSSFYFHGTAGFLAHLANVYIDRTPTLRRHIDDLLDADSLAAQRDLYFRKVHRAFWKRWLAWLAGSNVTLCLMGVPRPQIQQIRRHHRRVSDYIKGCLDAVFGSLPLADNYFWRVYLTGGYTPACCPEYLKPDNFSRLKAGLADRISTHTGSLTAFMETHPVPISRFVLLDHMDWLSTFGHRMLQDEWQAIVNRAAPDARVIWRSGAVSVDFVDPIRVRHRGGTWKVGDLLHYRRALAADLHARDRVHTYGSFTIADLSKA
jgi:S-adenosylmethionine-diacylglycerol 3-amino-3-carboxypropyl transferase